MQIGKAINLDPTMGYAWAIKTPIYLQDNEWDEAKISAERATELSPYNSGVWTEAGNYYNTVGSWEKAAHVYNRAIELNPTDFLSQAFVGVIYANLGEVESGLEHLDIAIAGGMSAARIMKGNILMDNGISDGFAQAQNASRAAFGLPENEDMQKFVDTDPSLRDGLRGQLKVLPTYQLAQVKALLLQDGEFFVKDAKAKIAITPIYFNPIMTNLFRAVMSQPAMKEYFTEIGLVDHWRETEWPSFCRAVGEDDFECDDGKGNWPE
jgi:tetratricopeptide (TPR) repeat protein